MKRLFCLLFVLVLCSCLAGCGDAKVETKIEYPFEEVSTIYDIHGQLLHQVLLNKETGDFLVKEFMYKQINGIWTCTSQHTTIIPKDKKGTPENASLNIYYNSDLADGPITILDNEWAKVSIVKYLAADSWWEFGYELKIYNKTNKVLSVLIDDTYIMDLQCKPLFSIDHVEAGKTAYFRMVWDKETLERCRIPYIDNIEFMVRVFDNEDWTVPALAGTRIMLKK